jgi:hypothetical protein
MKNRARKQKREG